MELDDLKGKWQRETDSYSELNKKKKEQLENMLKEKTGGVLRKIKDKWRFLATAGAYGMATNILISPFIKWIFGDGGPVFRMPQPGFIIVQVLITGSLIVFARLKYNSSKTTITGDSLKTALVNTISYLRKSLMRETYVIGAVFMLLIVGGRATAVYNGKAGIFDVSAGLIFAILLTASIFSILIAQRRKHYSRNIEELQGYLKELERE